MRFTNIQRHCFLTMILVYVFCLQITAGGFHALASDDDGQRPTELVVMIQSQLGLGAGIIFGRKDDRVYIATANHVVRQGTVEAENIQIMLKGLPGQWLRVDLMKHFDANSNMDLAVLALDGLKRHGIEFCSLPINRLGKPGNMKRGDPVYPVGYPNGAPWAIPIVPDRVAQVVGQQITFQSAFISSGHSGGALLNEDGELIGMIRADQPPFGVAINIHKIVESLNQWGYPMQLHTKAVENGKTWLHLAAEQGNLDKTRRLLQNCFYPNARDNRGRTSLHAATSHDRPKLVHLLLDAGALLNIKDKYGRTPLHVAVRSGNLDVVKLLVSRGAETDQSAIMLALDNPAILDLLLKQQPQLDIGLLYSSLDHGRPEVVERLLVQGLDANGSERYGRTPLYLAAKQGDLEMAAILLNHGASVNKGEGNKTPLHIAAKNGHLKMVHLLLANGAETDADAGGGYTPLYSAFQVGLYPRQTHIEVCRALLKAGAQFKAMRGNEENLLKRAVSDRDVELVRFLLNHGLDPNDHDEWYNPLGSVIDLKAEDAGYEIASLLVTHGTTVNSEWRDGGTLLLYAIYNGHPKIAQLLIEAGADVNMGNSLRSQKTPLHEASYRGMLQVVKSLLSNGARVNARSNRGESPLYTAAESSHVEVVRVLLAHGADPNPSGNNAWQPLLAVAGNGNLQIAKMLIEAGADVQTSVSDERFIPFHTAAREDHSDLLRLFIEAGTPVDLNIGNYLTALHLAVSNSKLAAARTLVGAGADVNAKDSNEKCPLSMVKGENAVPIAELLVKAGAKIESRDRNSQTPLHFAVLSREVSLAVYFIKAGADVNARDRQRNTPLHLAARDKKGGSMAKVLIEAGADLKAINIEKETALMVAERNNSDVYDVLQATLADN